MSHKLSFCFQNKFVEEMKGLENLVSISTTSLNDSLDEMKSSIQTNIGSVETITKEAKTKVTNFNEIWSEFRTKFSTVFTKDRLILEQCMCLKDNCQQTQTTDQQSVARLLLSVESAQKAIFEDIEKITQTVAQQRQDVEDLVMKQNSHIKRMASITAKSFESVKKDLELVFNRQSINPTFETCFSLYSFFR